MMKALLLAAANVCLFVAAPALAQVDQSNPYVVPPGGVASVSVSVDQYSPLYQSFTPALSGINYATFQFFSFASSTTAGGVVTVGPSVPATFDVSLYSGNGVFNSANFLGTTLPTVVPAYSSHADIQFNFANTISLNPGQVYTLRINDLTYVPGTFYDDDAIYTTGNTYPGGNAAPSPDADLVFSEGIRDGVAAAVPESATWAMMILGMAAIGFVMRRKVRESEVKFDAKIKQIAAGDVA